MTAPNRGFGVPRRSVRPTRARPATQLMPFRSSSFASSRCHRNFARRWEKILRDLRVKAGYEGVPEGNALAMSSC